MPVNPAIPTREARWNRTIGLSIINADQATFDVLR